MRWFGWRRKECPACGSELPRNPIGRTCHFETHVRTVRFDAEAMCPVGEPTEGASVYMFECPCGIRDTYAQMCWPSDTDMALTKAATAMNLHTHHLHGGDL